MRLDAPAEIVNGVVSATTRAPDAASRWSSASTATRIASLTNAPRRTTSSLVPSNAS